MLRISDNRTYDYKSFTLPDSRGKGYAHIRAQIMRDSYSAEDKKRPVLGYVSINNYPSLRANEKQGVIVLGYAGYWHVGGRYRFFTAKAVKQAGFRFDYPSQEEEI